MKKLKNFLIFFVVSIILSIFVYDIVKADTILNSVQYPVVESYLANNSGKTFEDFRNLVMSKIDKPSDFDDYNNYIVYINYNSNNNVVYPYFILANDMSFGNRYDSLLLRFGTTPNAKGYGGTCVLKFNNNYSDLSWVQTNDLTTSCDNLFVQEMVSLGSRNILSSSTPSSRPDLWNMIISSNLNELNYSYTGWDRTTFNINGNTYTFNSTIPFNDISYYNLSNFDYYAGPTEPTYTYQETILDNGNVKIDFTFTNYVEGGGYAFEIENSINNEEYGITNTYSNIFPNQIPFGNSYSIELPYDSLLYITLSKYEQIEQTTLYYREEIYTNIIDINNVVFENEQEPYFAIYNQNKNQIEGAFINTKNNDTCWYKYSTSQNEDFVPCNEMLGLNFYDNGYIQVLIKRNNDIIYSRKINYIGANDNEPYITYQINKKDFYSIVVWSVENELSNTTYRYSTNNGASYTNWETYNGTNNIINVFDNSTIIIEIANNDQSTIYDSKAIVVVNDITTIKEINNTTINIVNKFKNIFSVNSKILQNINSYYEAIRTSKIYLIIFIPFLTSLICAIIYLIRRK